MANPHAAEEKCPVPHNKAENADLGEIVEEPTPSQWERLEEVMGIMTRFYEEGRDRKEAQWVEAEEALKAYVA